MAKKIASELLVERLADWGSNTVFGLPGGDGINGIVTPLSPSGDRGVTAIWYFSTLVL